LEHTSVHWHIECMKQKARISKEKKLENLRLKLRKNERRSEPLLLPWYCCWISSVTIRSGGFCRTSLSILAHTMFFLMLSEMTCNTFDMYSGRRWHSRLNDRSIWKLPLPSAVVIFIHLPYIHQIFVDYSPWCLVPWTGIKLWSALAYKNHFILFDILRIRAFYLSPREGSAPAIYKVLESERSRNQLTYNNNFSKLSWNITSGRSNSWIKIRNIICLFESRYG
jgi:hypothetical protein